MKILAIDTSGKICSVSVMENREILKTKYNKSEREHSQTLMPTIKETLDELKLTIDDIDLLSCSRGPGSFTGIRVGMATIKALSDAKNIPIAGVDTLKALAYSAIIKKGKKECKILSMLDAKNENVYFAVFRIHNGNLSLYKNADVANISDVVEYINFNTPLYIVGDADPEKLDPLFKAKLSKQYAQGRETANYEYIEDLPVLSESIALAAQDKYDIGDYGDSNTLFPLYLRKPQAQKKKEKEDDKLYFLEMTKYDLENIKNKYDEFPNIWDYETFEEDFKNSNYIVAKQNNEVVGFIGVRTILDELEIMNIVTRRDKQNQGIASNLLSYLLRHYIGKNLVEKINLEVNEHNIRAISLYRKFGFREVGLRKKYYNNQEDAISMTL